MPSLRFRFCGMLLLVSFAQAVPAQDTPVPPAVEHFFANQRLSHPSLSPDGKLLAVIVGAPGKRDSLGVVDLETRKSYPTASYGDADISRYQWVNNRRLIYTLGDKRVGAAGVIYYPGLYAIDADGKNQRQLASRHPHDAIPSHLKSRMLKPTADLIGKPAPGP